MGAEPSGLSSHIPLEPNDAAEEGGEEEAEELGVRDAHTKI